MEYDKIITNLLISNKNKIRNGILRKIKSKYPNILSYLIKRYDDSESISETIRRIQYNIEKRPVCKVCGKKVNYIYNGNYRNVCSFKCGEIYCRERRFKTMIDKYGTPYPYKNKDIMNKMKENLEIKYGVDNPSKLENVKEKKKNTFIKHYGVDNYFKTEKSVKRSHTKECINKQYLTKIKNNSFGKSKQEDTIYEKIKEVYPDVIRQYKDKIRYPYNCDFYIPEIDLFIEYQGYYTHGKHPFNINNENDKELMEKYITKYGNKDQQYIIWCVKDVEKRNNAKNNNLNYIELFNFKKLDKLIEIIKNKDYIKNINNLVI